MAYFFGGYPSSVLTQIERIFRMQVSSDLFDSEVVVQLSLNSLCELIFAENENKAEREGLMVRVTELTDDQRLQLFIAAPFLLPANFFDRELHLPPDTATTKIREIMLQCAPETPLITRNPGPEIMKRLLDRGNVAEVFEELSGLQDLIRGFQQFFMDRYYELGFIREWEMFLCDIREVCEADGWTKEEAKQCTNILELFLSHRGCVPGCARKVDGLDEFLSGFRGDSGLRERMRGFCMTIGDPLYELLVSPDERSTDWLLAVLKLTEEEKTLFSKPDIRFLLSPDFNNLLAVLQKNYFYTIYDLSLSLSTRDEEMDQLFGIIFLLRTLNTIPPEQQEMLDEAEQSLGWGEPRDLSAPLTRFYCTMLSQVPSLKELILSQGGDPVGVARGVIMDCAKCMKVKGPHMLIELLKDEVAKCQQQRVVVAHANPDPDEAAYGGRLPRGPGMGG